MKNDATKRTPFATRRQALSLGVGGFAALALAACSPDDASSSNGASSSDASADATPVAIDATAYDSLIASGAVADDATVQASSWAKAIKDAGSFRVGTTRTSTLFSLLNETDGKLRGFDAGLSQLLARYILGDESKIEVTQVTSDTRESVLTNGQVDAVFATYSITDARKKLISFAGPYYTSQQGILVKADNTDINGVDDLKGKNVAAQSGSTGPGVVAEFAPEAKVQEFSTDEEARTALEQGRVDAYIIDITLHYGSVAKNPGKYRIAGDPFGPDDPYGIGLPLDSDGVAFVNAFLKKVEDEGTWAKLWQIAIGDRTGVASAPEAPAIQA
ncbi:glutamate ABC transporter substrate-binding protein [Olsenella sp. DNF00959]|uniref:glutamate ABC transporter substrate-binding protein n=1 Tax=Olsenella sp. DNF00959 TaxID=1476999 RepID=UPI0007805CA4|nr:glutamate ABC transporter substrate-binding protein [Olsenella sp. DNF00959]KXB63035.1 ABC transporter glutamine-binding protein GlnH family protein [Olsenella sp. DNF00959]